MEQLFDVGRALLALDRLRLQEAQQPVDLLRAQLLQRRFVALRALLLSLLLERLFTLFLKSPSEDFIKDCKAFVT
jgi:hypothetical protein